MSYQPVYVLNEVFFTDFVLLGLLLCISPLLLSVIIIHYPCLSVPVFSPFVSSSFSLTHSLTPSLPHSLPHSLHPSPLSLQRRFIDPKYHSPACTTYQEPRSAFSQSRLGSQRAPFGQTSRRFRRNGRDREMPGSLQSCSNVAMYCT